MDFYLLSQIIQEEHWFFTWDLKSGYHHVDNIWYLGFAGASVVCWGILLAVSSRA